MIYRSTDLAIYLSIDLHPPGDLPIYRSTDLTIYTSIDLASDPQILQPTDPTIYISTDLPIHRSIRADENERSSAALVAGFTAGSLQIVWAFSWFWKL